MTCQHPFPPILMLYYTCGGTGSEGCRQRHDLVLTARRLPNGDAPLVWPSGASGSMTSYPKLAVR